LATLNVGMIGYGFMGRKVCDAVLRGAASGRWEETRRQLLKPI
jgi:hypothetical protein